MSNRKDIKVRFNTNFPKRSDKRWRVIVDGVEELVDFVEINCKSHTSEDNVEVDSVIVTKHHISCLAENVAFVKSPEGYKAIII